MMPRTIAVLLGVLSIGCFGVVADADVGDRGGDDNPDASCVCPADYECGDGSVIFRPRIEYSCGSRDAGCPSVEYECDYGCVMGVDDYELAHMKSAKELCWENYAVCGNGIIEPGEQCDGPGLGGESCSDLGEGGGTLNCDPVTCTFDISMCTPCKSREDGCDP